jgi:hypothetical protein
VSELRVERDTGHDAARRVAASLGPVVTLRGVPDDLVCRSVQPVERTDDGWRIVRDRRRRLRLDEVALRPAEDAASRSGALPAAAVAYRRFVLGAARRNWSAISQRLGADAWELSLDLVRAGVVTVVCKAGETLELGSPQRWHLTESGADLAAAFTRELVEHLDATDSELARIVAELERAQSDLMVSATAASGDETTADACGLVALGLSEAAVGTLIEALRAGQPGSTRDVLLAVSRDLLSGVQHDSPRAFSLAHFADSKERDDVAARLEDAGVDPDVARALGVLRAPRLGVAGHLRVCTYALHGAEPAAANVVVCRGGGWEVTELAGPTLMRTDTAGLHLHLTGRDVVVLENLQAAEAVDERRRRQQLPLAVLYCAGVPGAGTRALIAQVAQQVAAADGRVLLCPDADFGGVRIAEAIVAALDQSALDVTRISDIGAWPHLPQRPWRDGSESRRGLTAAVDGAAGALACVCLDRGYRVEQEQAIVTAVQSWLDGDTRGTFEPLSSSSAMSGPSSRAAP